MKQSYPEYWPQYFTATIHEWKPLLFKEEHTYIIINCLQFSATLGKQVNHPKASHSIRKRHRLVFDQR